MKTLSRYAALVAALVLSALVLSACTGQRHAIRSTMRAQLLGETTIEHDLLFEGTVVGGLSGIDMAPDGTWYLISDDRSARGPARFYTASIDVRPPGAPRVRLTGVTTIRDRDGNEHPRGAVDPEAIRYDPASGTLWWTSEGDERALVDPFVREMRIDGSYVRQLPLPSMFRMDTVERSGPRNNGVFEGLAISSDATMVIASMEETLKQDGPGPTRFGTGPIRISYFDRASGRHERQIVYDPDHPEQPDADTLVAVNGVVEILPIDATWLLVLERAYSPQHGNTVRLYAADVSSATNVASVHSIPGLLPQHARKLLVADFAELGLSRVDNIEGMSWGPRLPDGRRTLVLVSDNNFNPAQVTQIIALAIE
jgi:hypothetical protein